MRNAKCFAAVDGCIYPKASISSSMSLHEIETALSGLSAEELAHVEITLRTLRARNIPAARRDGEKAALKNGFDVFPKRPGEPVTIELVRQLCVEEGI